MLISRIPPYYTTAFGRPRNVVTARPAVWWRSARRPASQSAQLAPSAAKPSQAQPARACSRLFPAISRLYACRQRVARRTHSVACRSFRDSGAANYVRMHDVTADVCGRRWTLVSVTNTNAQQPTDSPLAIA